MLNRSLLVVLVLVAMSLVGCGTYGLFPDRVYGGYSVDNPGSGTLAPYAQLKAALVRSKAASSPAGAEGALPPTGIVDASCFSASGNDCELQRNEAIAALMIGSDAQCIDHRRSIYGNEAGYNVLLGSAAGLFAGWASVLTNTHPYRSSILGAMSLFATSERSLVNETIYKTMIVTAVDQKIVQNRDTKAQAIKAKFSKGIAEWPLNEALADWVDFHTSCSFMTGLQLALAEGTQGADVQKTAKLKSSFDVVSAQIRLNKCAVVAAPAKGESAPQEETDPVCKSLTDQLATITTALNTMNSK